MEHPSERVITSPLSLPPPEEFVSFGDLRELRSAPGTNGDMLPLLGGSEEDMPQLLGGSEEEFSDAWEDSDEEDWIGKINEMIPSQLYAKILKEKEKKHNSDSDDESTRYASFLCVGVISLIIFCSRETPILIEKKFTVTVNLI
jgi:hypothetical protein